VILCDSGPLIATAIEDDDDYQLCTELFTGLRLANRPLLVPPTVVAEVGYMIGNLGDSIKEATFLQSLGDGELELVDLTPSDLSRMAALVTRYADLPLGTTDASVIAVAERLGVIEIATLDRRHFTVVRPGHVRALTLLPELA
jgi:hypothetical protein